jgi:hypothetical protein
MHAWGLPIRKIFGLTVRIGAFGYGVREGLRENAATRNVIMETQLLPNMPPNISDSAQIGWVSTVDSYEAGSAEEDFPDELTVKTQPSTEDTVQDNNDQTAVLQRSVRQIMANPAILEGWLPRGLPDIPREREAAFINAVVQCLQNDDVIASARILESKPSRHQSQTIVSTVHNACWYDLIGKQKCSICQDLYASPCVISCGHSFCGECLQEHITKCECVDGSIQVGAKCPLCKMDIVGAPTFELQLDEDIADKVQSFPDCEEKRDWSTRRAAYRSRVALESCRTTCVAIEGDSFDEEWIAAVGIVVLLMVAFGVALSRSSKRQ